MSIPSMKAKKRIFTEERFFITPVQLPIYVKCRKGAKKSGQKLKAHRYAITGYGGQL